MSASLQSQCAEKLSSDFGVGKAGLAARVREPDTTIAAMVPATEDNGLILFAQLDLQRRLDSTKPTFDPAAESLLLSLLGEGTNR
jgi:hypothetical protein